jgi:hypothetical protein
MEMEMQRYIDSLIKINNDAIELMQNANFEQSIYALHDGLQLLHSVQHAPWMLNATRKGPQTSSFGSEVVLLSVELNNGTSDMEDDIVVFFNRALKIDDGFSSIVKDSPAYAESNSFLLGVLLYNLGLAHHLLGIKRGNSELYDKALDFYSLSHGSFTDQLYPFGYPTNSLHVGILAITNNVGHIHAYFRRSREVQICIDELILRLSQYSRRNNQIPEFNGEQKVFLINASFYQEMALNAAPAA